jgi:hypothetical protein
VLRSAVCILSDLWLIFLLLQMVRTHKKSSTYSLWTEDIMKSTVNSLMRENVSIRAASKSLKIPNTTLLKMKPA